ncbi:hypothetical protein [Olsenella massiliensis]|uniref:hypothetical protein n=1 Tax=Olsenella massiliensis TaxID=1622075 RepID=UPI00071DBDE4|nr:hypothetical protein [Olsenella massiliensis]
MSFHKGLCCLGGVALAGVVAGLQKSGVLHKSAVTVTSGAMAVGDAVSAETQSIIDAANDMRAEARRKAKIDALVKAEIAAIEPSMREKATAKVDNPTA